MPKIRKNVVPGIVLGLYIGRCLSEFVGNPGLLVAVIVTAVAALGGAWLASKRALRDTWPALLLAGYVLYPDNHPVAALWVLALAAGTWTLLRYGRWNQSANSWEITPLLKRSWPMLLLLFCGGLYLATLAPGMLPADGGEFQLVAAQLGVAHPPGFPLYTLLAHLMTRLPLALAPATGVNLLSAITSTITLGLMYLIVLRLTGRRLAATTAVLALATATTFWAQATTANIRSLTATFTAAMLLALVVFWRRTRHDTDSSSPPDHALLWFGLALGFGLTHHASLVFMGAVFALFLALTDPTLLGRPRRWLRPLLATLSGLLPLLYLPLRANANVRGAAPDLATRTGFLDHVLARGFSGDFFYFIEPAILWERLRIMGSVMSFQFHPWLLAGMGFGLLLLLWQRQWRLAVLLGGSFALHTVITATYRAPQTVEYMLPAYVPAVILVGIAAARVQDQVQRGAWRALLAPLPVLLLLTAVFQGAQRYPSFAALSQDQTARDYAQGLLDQAPPNALVLADWHWVTPLWYLQEVEGVRTDASVRFVFPDSDDYSETWARRIGEGLAGGQVVIATHGNENSYPGLPAPSPLGDGLLFAPETPAALLNRAAPQDILLGEAVHVTGFWLETDQVAIGEEAVLTLAWEALAPLPPPLTLFAHLVGTDGRLYAQQDLSISDERSGVRLTQFRLTPRPGAAPGSYALLIGAYGAEPLPDRNGETRTDIARLRVAAQSQQPATANRLYRPMRSEERTLVGFDWDNTLAQQPRLYLHWHTDTGYETEVYDGNIDPSSLLPAYKGPWGIASFNWSALNNPGGTHYVPLGQSIVWQGQSSNPMQNPLSGTPSPVPFELRFTAGRPVLSDQVVSVRLIGYEADGFHWAWWDLHDSVPALGAVPTLKWIGGSQVYDPHWLQVSETAVNGQAAGALLRLYDAFTERPLPILDERITQSYLGIPLGSTTIQKETATSE